MASEAEIVEGLFKQKIFADIMSKFDSQTLTYKGKGGKTSRLQTKNKLTPWRRQ